MRNSPKARVRAVLRAAILLGVVLDPPVLGRVTRALTPAPVHSETTEHGTTVAVVAPSRGSRWPTWIFVNGAHPDRREEPVVSRLVDGLARAGFLVLVPEPPGLSAGEITPATRDSVVGITAAALARPDVRDGRVALIGASTGASLAIVAAGDEAVRDRISVVVAVTPFADLEKIVCLATTSAYETDGAFVDYEVTELMRSAVRRSLLASGGEDPAVAALLSNGDCARFAELYSALPDHVTTAVRTLSPIAAADGVRAHVEIVVPPRDEYFPPAEAAALAEALDSVELTTTAALDHTRPSLVLGRARDALSFLAFVVRGLRIAATSPPPTATRGSHRRPATEGDARRGP